LGDGTDGKVILRIVHGSLLTHYNQ